MGDHRSAAVPSASRFHGLAFAMVLYLISVGLSVTMGLMGFVNLAHGVFAMAGGYVVTTLMNRYGVPFPSALSARPLAVALASIALERLLYRRLYGGDELDQVLLTMGLIFMSVAGATYFWGPLQQPLQPPHLLSGQIDLGFRSFPAYRSFLIVCGAVLVTGLWLGLERTRFGAQIRAAVDNLRMAQSVGINTSRLFRLTFALGSGLAGSAARSAPICWPINPGYALQNLVYFLIVVAVGGLGSIRGPFFAALLLGIADTAFKYLAARVRRLLHLCADHGDPAVAAARPVRPRLMPRCSRAIALSFARRHRFRPLEALPWLAAIAAYFVFPDYLPLGAQILATILFALSLDLVLGYAGIVTLGHAAFFGTGAYTAGLLAAHGWGEPISGLLAAAAAAALVGFLSGVVILRTTGLTLLMQTLVVAAMLYEAANKATSITGGADGLQGMEVWPIFGPFRFDLFGRTAYIYCLVVLFLGWLAARRIVHSPFGRSLDRHSRERAAHARDRRAGRRRRLIVYTISAALAGISGALIAQTTQFVGLTVLGLERSGSVLIMLIIGGVGRLYGAFIGVPLYMIAQDRFSDDRPGLLVFLDRPVDDRDRDLRPRRRARPCRAAVARRNRLAR